MFHSNRTPIVLAKNGETFSIPAKIWQRNQEQERILLRYLALPLAENAKQLWLGIDDLENLTACEFFSFFTGKVVEPVLIESEHLKQLLQQLTPKNQINEQENVQYTAFENSENPAESLADDEPVILLLNQIFEQALQKNASDIHLEPQAEALFIRLRIDGVLHLQQKIGASLAKRIISRLKLLAKLDISEMRLPQDGRFEFKTTFGEQLEFRVSTLPTNYGEKAVLRVQKNTPLVDDFEKLGMTAEQKALFQKALSQPQGLILVTGPTGSGKSISLYSALSWLNDSEKHILTAEDPIEIEVQGVVQSQINPQIGLTFSRLLRTFLRQDPDIIMLGEIRDEESAQMALRAAQTGHLVLSTLHTNDAQSALARLQQLGIKPFEIESSLLLVIAQRLLRKCCQNCLLGKKQDCHCQEGYQGRVGIYQFLQGQSLHEQEQDFILDYPNLATVAQLKVNQGITDKAEVKRVLG